MTATTTARDLPDLEELEARVIEALKTVYDPEIPVNIYELGLIYGLDVDPLGSHVEVQMTLTAPGCGMGPAIAQGRAVQRRNTGAQRLGAPADIQDVLARQPEGTQPIGHGGGTGGAPLRGTGATGARRVQ